MDWILIGVVAGSLIVSGHASEEACLGRKAVLDKQKIAATCVKAPSNFTTSTVTLCPNCIFTTPNAN
jgi:hypothetical protein